MIELQKYEVLAVRAAINALVIVWAKGPKGRKKLNEAIELLQSQALISQVAPLDRCPRAPNRALLDEGVLYLETIRQMVDEARV